MRCGRLGCVALLSLSCVRADPNHCANLDGDATCREIEAGMFCSACGATNFGCVEDRPDDACYFESSSPIAESSSGSGSGSGSSGSDESGESSSSGPPPACALEGELDPVCPENNPYCIDGACGTCDRAAATFCGELDAAKTICEPDWGRCVECTSVDESACESNRFCGLEFSCGGCTRHAQCPNSACNLETGVCMDDGPVLHVDEASCPAGTGTAADPYCEISLAVAQIASGEQGTIVLHGNGAVYEGGIILSSNPPRTLAVLGAGDPAIVATSGGWAANVADNMKLFVSGVFLSSGTGSGVQCNGDGARLWLDQSTIRNNADGIVADECRVQLRRSHVIDNEGYGVQLVNGAHLLSVSSVIANNGVDDGETAGLSASASTFDLRYTTIAGNRSALEGENVYCAAGLDSTIRNSVIVGEGISVDCPWAVASFSVLDNDSVAGNDNVDVDFFDEDWFRDVESSDFHVRMPGSSYFADVARWELGDPILDLDAESRAAYPGASGFAGADEP